MRQFGPDLRYEVILVGASVGLLREVIDELLKAPIHILWKAFLTINRQHSRWRPIGRRICGVCRTWVGGAYGGPGGLETGAPDQIERMVSVRGECIKKTGETYIMVNKNGYGRR
jgi:hypothetical protein